jgi:hypothetical protein
MGSVIDGAQSVVQALLGAVGPTGTLVGPAPSWQLCDPAYLADPAVPEEAWPLIRDTLPVFDPAVTPSQTMGAVAELLRTYPGRSEANTPIAPSVRSATVPRRSWPCTSSTAQMVNGRRFQLSATPTPSCCCWESAIRRRQCCTSLSTAAAPCIKSFEMEHHSESAANEPKSRASMMTAAAETCRCRTSLRRMRS